MASSSLRPPSRFLFGFFPLLVLFALLMVLLNSFLKA